MSAAGERTLSTVWAEAERRAAGYREGLERMRRERGLWVGGEDGKPRWLPPGSPALDDHRQREGELSPDEDVPRNAVDPFGE